MDQEITLTGLPLPNQGSSIRIAFSGSSHSRPSRDRKNSTTIHTQYVDTTGRPVPSWPPQKCPGSYTMRDFCLGRGYQVISLVLRSRTRELAQIENCMSRTILLFPGEFTYRIVYEIVSECPCRRMLLYQATWSVIDVWYRLTRRVLPRSYCHRLAEAASYDSRSLLCRPPPGLVEQSHLIRRPSLATALRLLVLVCSGPHRSNHRVQRPDR